MSFTIGSLFDGSGGFPLAATMCGGTPKWASEVEPYPIAVTKSRFPNVKHLGSVTDIKGGKVEPVDVIAFGSPCQDLSVAGKRAGLKHTDNGDDETTRSGLFMEAVRIIKEMREATNGVYPRFALWENVPGAFSSNKGEDFRIVLEELIKIAEPSAVMPEVPKNGWPYADSYCGDGWSIAYRVLDAQYWGVPQRRRRIYLVADFRGECAGKISFEREGMRGHFETGRTPWQTTPGDAESCFGAADCKGNRVIAVDQGGGKSGANFYDNLSPTLTCTHAGEPVVSYALDQQGGKGGANYAEDVMLTLCSDSHGTPHAVAYSFDALSSNSMKSSNPHSGCRQVGVAKCLDTTDPNPCKNQGGIAIVEQVPYTLKIRSGCEGGGKGALIQTDMSATLATNNDQYLFQPICMATQQGGAEIMTDKCPTITASAGMSGNNQPVVCYPDLILDDQGGQQISVRDDGKCHTLTARCGTGGNNVPAVVTGDPVYCLQGNGIDRADTAGCNGKGVKEDVCYTLNTIDRPAVAFQTYQKVTGPLMANSHPGSYTGQDAFCDMLVAGVDCRNATEYPELNGTLQAKANGGFSYNCNQVVRIQYIVRRLTPTECARLQGFPDTWGHPDEKTEFTDEEYQFWLNVRNTHAVINGKATKEHTKDQILRWYNGLHTDSSEYKMWGNGIALPNALYMMQGIADVMTEEKAARRKWLNDLLGGCL